MRALRLVVALGACAVVASCATTPPASGPPPPGSTQELLLRTDPAGATCSVLRDGSTLATVESTPGSAVVSRDVCHGLSGPACGSIDVVCRKDGFLESRITFRADRVDAALRKQLGPPPERTPEQKAIGAAAGIAYLGAMVFPPALIVAAPAVALGLAGGALAGQAALPRAYAYGYRTPPVLFMTPAAFESESACDAHFAAVGEKLVAEANAQLALIDRECRYFPCGSSDPQPCPHPECQKQRAAVDAQLKARLEELPGLRAQVRIVAP